MLYHAELFKSYSVYPLLALAVWKKSLMPAQMYR